MPPIFACSASRLVVNKSIRVIKGYEGYQGLLPRLSDVRQTLRAARRAGPLNEQLLAGLLLVIVTVVSSGLSQRRANRTVSPIQRSTSALSLCRPTAR